MHKMTEDQLKALEEVKEALGGTYSQVASRLGVRTSAVTNWRLRGRVPLEQAMRLEAMTGVSAKRLCREFFEQLKLAG